MSDDGVALTSTAHPRAPWYKRVWFALRRPKLSPDSLETVEINIKMNDNEIEKEIQAKGLTAPRVHLADIEAVIAYEYYITGDEIHDVSVSVLGPAHKSVSDPEAAMLCLTLCVLVLANGFTVTGESACASPENFNAELGRKRARQKAIDKIWAFEGYLLKERLHVEARYDRHRKDGNDTKASDDPLGRPRTL
jgi:hypothetical protein